ncbi:tetratricopeptide repeat protein [Idiomarina aminovorans]|uniref:tetratricopeptide repeat protein n=1 Tax=Idiomarina aminovorans TaxID=2914829 RepID=UPI002005A1D6|nr:tetratricopeptide repeat protein [Idiomarina sp. ATCH4]MCK7459561.1 tetratricopeptide repeat protein [Idiomarina sp. ATCH4]
MSSVDEQIGQNRAKKKKRIVTSVISVFFVCLLIGVVVTLLAYFPVSGGAGTPEASEPEPENLQQSANLANEAIDRKALQTALNETNQRVSDLVSIPYLSTWQPAKVEGFQGAIEQAFNDYGASNYNRAQVAVEQLNKDIADYQAAFEQAYKQPYENAATAFADDEIDDAAQLNAQALKVKGDYSDALALQKRIDTYHEVADLYEQARVGGVEANIEKQRAAYQQILKLDPQQPEAKNALTRVEQQIKQQRFARALASAVDAIDDKDFGRAQEALAKASAIDNNRSELATLQAQIDAELKSQGVKALEKRIQVFAGADEWQTVLMLAEKGLVDHPDSQIVQQAKQSAVKILAAGKALDVYIERPGRLTDNNIRQNAVNAVSEYSGLTQLSAKLGEKIDRVEQLIEQENQPIDVTIRSDNRTYIKVLGVGVVGEVREKTIQLKPGNYQFEGRREGYRSVIVNVVVAKSGTPIVINVQCNERV